MEFIKKHYLVLSAIMILVLALPLFSTNTSIYGMRYVNYTVLVKAEDSFLSYGNTVDFVITPSLGPIKYNITLNPFDVFKIERISNYMDYTLITAKIVKENNKAELVKGLLTIFHKNTVIINETFYLFLVPRQKIVISSEGIEIFFNDEENISMWHWFIRAPHKAGFKIFIAPALYDFNLLSDYLNLEVFVKRVTLRNNTWWPLRNLGAFIVNKSLNELISIEKQDNYYIINVTEWPEYVNGVTIAYSGKIAYEKKYGYNIYNLKLGFTSPLNIYIIVPARLEVVGLFVGNIPIKTYKCLYAPQGYGCYCAKINTAILNNYEIEIVISTS
ncbi:MAG: hypothetical protein J7L82_00900 [Staphylothermus sp.]|nr:hypothetical protein [Staphylothermus sp.]